MPPKAAPGPSKKTEAKKKEKVVEDKTFGLKNKKGAKQQKFIQQVQKQVHFGGNPSSRKLEAAKAEERDKKKVGEDPLTKDLFKPVQTVGKGADPKSILCAFFKQGSCAKGDKCKFSHDLTIERKAEKRSLYCDERGEEEAATMEDWDEEKLKEVVEKKHSKDNAPNKTDKICKYFIEAVEKSKYGWFWECPNGGSNCIYRHALPPGFVLKKDLKKMEKDNKENETSLEDWIENERCKLIGRTDLTKVTDVSFVAWKKRKLVERREEVRAKEEKKLRDFKLGRSVGLSGRDMFTFNPELAADQAAYDDDDDEGEDVDYNAFRNGGDGDDGEEVDTNEYKEITFDDFYYNIDDEPCPSQNKGKVPGEEIAKEIENLEIDEDLFDDEDEEID